MLYPLSNTILKAGVYSAFCVRPQKYNYLIKRQKKMKIILKCLSNYFFFEKRPTKSNSICVLTVFVVFLKYGISIVYYPKLPPPLLACGNLVNIDLIRSENS